MRLFHCFGSLTRFIRYAFCHTAQSLLQIEATGDIWHTRSMLNSVSSCVVEKRMEKMWNVIQSRH